MGSNKLTFAVPKKELEGPRAPVHCLTPKVELNLWLTSARRTSGFVLGRTKHATHQQGFRALKGNTGTRHQGGDEARTRQTTNQFPCCASYSPGLKPTSNQQNTVHIERMQIRGSNLLMSIPASPVHNHDGQVLNKTKLGDSLSTSGGWGGVFSQTSRGDGKRGTLLGCFCFKQMK